MVIYWFILNRCCIITIYTYVSHNMNIQYHDHISLIYITMSYIEYSGYKGLVISI
jgi:hypothetical protein